MKKRKSEEKFPKNIGITNDELKHFLVLVGDKEHAELILHLKPYGLREREFFRAVIKAFIEREPNFMVFFEKFQNKIRPISRAQAKRIRASRKKEEKINGTWGLTDEEIKMVFDEIEEGDQEGE